MLGKMNGVNCGISGPLHCSDIQDGDATGSGVYAIRAGSRRIKVFCDLTTTDGGWTVRTSIYSYIIDEHHNVSICNLFLTLLPLM